MPDTKIQIVVEAVDRATKPLQAVGSAFSKVAKQGESLTETLKKAAVPSAALATSLAFGVRSVLNASQELENSLLGLGRVAKAVGVEETRAKEAAQELARDGLMSVRDASEALKNLLATGFSLPEAIQLMDSFKDAAAFNRQGTLEFGQAIVGATQGIKNQNSVMVDNVGITKNLSVILKEAGLEMADWQEIAKNSEVRQKILNGLTQEASIFLGDAAALTETYSGKMSALNVQIFEQKALLGEKLKPAMITIIEKASDLVDKTGDVISFFDENREALILFAGAITGALVPAIVAAVTALSPLIPFVVAGGTLALLFTWLDKLSQETTGFTLFEQLRDFIIILVDNLSWLRDTVKETIGDIFDFANKAIDAVQRLLGLQDQVGGGGGGGGGTAGDFISRPGMGVQKFSPNDTIVGFRESDPTPALAGGGSTTFNATVNVGMFAGSALEKRKIAEELMNEFRLLARSQGKTTLEAIAGHTNISPI
jgi:hypothetical protein